MVLTIIFTLSLCLSAHAYVDPGWTDLQKDLDGGQNLNESFFPKLLNYHIDAKQSDEQLRKYMAKVIHSEHKPFPVVCTAACISTRVFLTASRCIYRTAPRYVRLMYNGVSVSAAAFAVPQNETKQQFDDIGFIITNREWNQPFFTIELVSHRDRPDRVFRWFASTTFSDPYIVVGYATVKRLLTQLVTEKIHIIENKDTSTNTNNMKKAAWQDVLSCFNSLNKNKRDLTQIMTQWRNTKGKVKSRESEYRRARLITGGGPPPLSPSAEDLAIIQALPNEFIVDSNHFDSDSIYMKTIKQGYYNQQENTNFNLTELPVVLDINLCYKIYTLNLKINGFHVPCLHSCSYEQFQYGDKACAKYHGVEGSAVIRVTGSKEQLYGIVTWGAQGNRPLPVGFTTMNTRLFRNNFGCARKIADDKSKRTKGHFQQLCDSVNIQR